MNVKNKAGEPAFIVKAIREKNIGKIVTPKALIGFVNAGNTFRYNGEAWVSVVDGYLWCVEGNLETMYGDSREGFIPDHWLKPVKPDNFDETLEEELVEELHAT
jgi:hypothetical protein